MPRQRLQQTLEAPLITIIFRAVLIHLSVTGILAGGIWHFWGATAGLSVAWGSALGFLPTLGFAMLTAPRPTPETTKKGVALIVTGSVLRYGIFIFMLALLVFMNVSVSAFLLVGLFVWIPSAGIEAILSRRTKE